MLTTSFYRLSFFVIFITLTFLSLKANIDSLFLYLAFNIASFCLILNATSKKSSFFDVFIAFYLNMGFFLKFHFSVLVLNDYIETLGVGKGFDKSSKDELFLLVVVAYTSIILASFVCRNFLHNFRIFNSKDECRMLKSSIFLYQKHRVKILFLYLAIASFVIFTNYNFDIYSRGLVPRHDLLLLNFIYKFLLTFGFSFFFLSIIFFEIKNKKILSIFYLIYLPVEGLFTSVSIMSRGMILSVLPIFIGIFKHCKINKVIFNIGHIKYLFIFIISIFLISLYLVNNNRDKLFSNVNLVSYDSLNSKEKFHESKYDPIITNFKTLITYPKIQSLLIDRWIGYESAAAVVLKKDKNLDLLIFALKEKDTKTLSFYDKFFIDSPYKYIDNTKRHFITLPGFIPFLYYSGSLSIVFLFTALFVFFAHLIENISLKFTYGNFMISALIANLTAYRFVSFGYAPINTILYFSVILFTVFLYFYFLKLIERIKIENYF